MSRFLDVARTAALAGGYIVRERAGRVGDSWHKSGPTDLVTDVDIAAGVAVARSINSALPGSRFLIEEAEVYELAEVERGDAGTGEVWVVDPIDGTKAFVREYPMFSTQIALMRRGRLIVGVSSAPVYGEIAYGEIGVGAWLNEQPIRVSGIDAIESAALSTGNLKTLATGPQWPAFGRLVGRLNRIRGYGDFLHYHLLASGDKLVFTATPLALSAWIASAALSFGGSRNATKPIRVRSRSSSRE